MHRVYIVFTYDQLTDYFVVVNIVLDHNAFHAPLLSEDFERIDHRGSGSE